MQYQYFFFLKFKLFHIVLRPIRQFFFILLVVGEKPRDVDNICNRTPLANATIYTTCFVRYDFRISRWDFTLTS